MWILFICILASPMRSYVEGEMILMEDLLIPYSSHEAGSKRSHRSVKECQPIRYNNVTFELYKSHFTSDQSEPVFRGHQFTQPIGTYWTEDVLGNMIIVNNPFKTLSILEPKEAGGCKKNIRSTVAESGRQKHCFVAMNGGMFNTTSGACLGNVVVDGVVRHDSGGVQNAHFGIKKDSSLFIGYLPADTELDDFKQLIGGVIWLVRDGVNYVRESIEAECEDTQETGTLRGFAEVQSARTAIGHNAAGQVVLIEIDGKTWHRGINLDDFADLLIKFGVVNAINLDGGGSATLVINGTLVSHPSDEMIDNATGINYTRARPIATIVCVQDYQCNPADCNKHGDCHHGECYCHDNWAGPTCSHVQCGPLNCSDHGECRKDGCHCSSGWTDKDCNNRCKSGSYGIGCAHKCLCANGASCDSVDGSCKCQPGYAGLICDQECPYGFFGDGCRQICYCQNSCSCHPITGLCTTSYKRTHFWMASMCLAESFILERNLVPENLQQYRLWVITTILLATIAAASIILNISMLCINCTCTLAGTRGGFTKRRNLKQNYNKSNIYYDKYNYGPQYVSYSSGQVTGKHAQQHCSTISSVNNGNTSTNESESRSTSDSKSEQSLGFEPSKIEFEDKKVHNHPCTSNVDMSAHNNKEFSATNGFSALGAKMKELLNIAEKKGNTKRTNLTSHEGFKNSQDSSKAMLGEYHDDPTTTTSE